MTIAEAHERIRVISGTTHECPLSRNKGKPGLLLETLTGIPNTSNCLDCADGEIKSFPLVRNKAGALVPKETVAVTMLDRTQLSTHAFQDSKCYKKLRRTLYVPYFRDGDRVTFLEPRLILLDDRPDILAKLQADYDAIRSQYHTAGTLASGNGVYLQNRTKGAGHGSTSRAFYLRKSFLTEFVLNSE